MMAEHEKHEKWISSKLNIAAEKMLYVFFKLYRPEGHRTKIEVYNVRCIDTVKA